MKKLALLGISNLILKYGYGAILENRMGEDCLLCGLGQSPSLTSIFTLLHDRIINEYEFVGFDYNIIDTHYLENGYASPETIASWLLYAIKLFRNSSSTPLIIITPHRPVPLFRSASWLYRGIGRIYNIRIIDIEKMFADLPTSSIAHPVELDHFTPQYQEIIASSILSAMAAPKLELAREWECRINFFCPSAKSLLPHLPAKNKKTSLLAREVVEFSLRDSQEIPPDRYLCGLFYWCDKTSPYIALTCMALRIVKNPNINLTGFFCRPMAALCLGEAPGGIFSLTLNMAGGILEPDNCEPYAPESLSGNVLLLHALCWADRNPWHYGRQFLHFYSELFSEEKNALFNLVSNASIYPSAHMQAKAIRMDIQPAGQVK